MSIFNDFDNIFGKGFFTAMPDQDGGHSIMKNGSVVDHLTSEHKYMTADLKSGEFVMKTPNVHGGEDTFVNGKLKQSTIPNVHGGEDVFDQEYNPLKKNMPNIHGGTDMYDAGMQLKGFTVPNNFGAENMLVLNDDVYGNAAQIMGYDDPLAHAGYYKLPSFYFK